MDFTLTTYCTLIDTLQKQGFSFQTLLEFIAAPEKRVIILRHDVDKLPANSLRFARIQADKGIKGTYYFRIVPGSFDKKIIKEIYSLGHDVGYHYEDVSLTAERQKTKVKRQKWGSQEDHEKYLIKFAIENFKENLQELRKIVPVKTICMHGSPMSRWDSRLLWEYYDYRDFGIIGEPYFDVNFEEVLYLTDTGRGWDGDSYNIRDKAEGKAVDGRLQAVGQNDLETQRQRNQVGKDSETKRLRDEETSQSPSVPQSLSPLVHSSLQPFPKFHSTFDIIYAAENGLLPDKIMMTFHPQRWTDKPVPWVKELVWQNVKNVGKYFMLKILTGNQ